MNALTPETMSKARLPEVYAQARTALTKCARMDECKEWADKAAALASYAKQAEDEDLEKMARRIRARALRRYGELRNQIGSAAGGRPGENQSTSGPVSTRSAADAASGMSPRKGKQASAIAKIPTDQFEGSVEGEKPPTVTQLAKAAPKPKAKPKPPKNPDREAAAFLLKQYVDFREYLRPFDLEKVLPHLTDDERATFRKVIAEIDALNDTISTRI